MKITCQCYSFKINTSASKHIHINDKKNHAKLLSQFYNFQSPHISSVVMKRKAYSKMVKPVSLYHTFLFRMHINYILLTEIITSTDECQMHSTYEISTIFLKYKMHINIRSLFFFTHWKFRIATEATALEYCILIWNLQTVNTSSNAKQAL